MRTDGYMTAEELQALIYADIDESAEYLRDHLARKKAYRDYQFAAHA